MYYGYVGLHSSHSDNMDLPQGDHSVNNLGEGSVEKDKDEVQLSKKINLDFTLRWHSFEFRWPILPFGKGQNASIEISCISVYRKPNKDILVALGEGNFGMVMLCDLSKDKNWCVNVYTDAVNYVTFSPDGKYLANSDVNGRIGLFNVKYPNLISGRNDVNHCFIEGKTGAYCIISFSFCSKYLLCVTSDQEVSFFKVEDLFQQVETAWKIKFPGSITQAKFITDKKVMVRCSNGDVFLKKLDISKENFGNGDWPRSKPSFKLPGVEDTVLVEVCPEGERLAIAHKSIILIYKLSDLEQHYKLSDLEQHSNEAQPKYGFVSKKTLFIKSLSWSADCRFIASSNDKGIIQIHTFESAIEEPVRCISVKSDDNNAFVACSPKGFLVAVGSGGRLRIVDLLAETANEQEQLISIPEDRNCESFTWSPDGKYIAVCTCGNDGFNPLYIYDLYNEDTSDKHKLKSWAIESYSACCVALHNH